jgi:hypothetical protein
MFKVVMVVVGVGVGSCEKFSMFIMVLFLLFNSKKMIMLCLMTKGVGIYIHGFQSKEIF